MGPGPALDELRSSIVADLYTKAAMGKTELGGMNFSGRTFSKELDKIDAQMQALNLEKDTLQTQLATIKAPAELAQTGKRVKAIDLEIGQLEERWLELTEQIETAAA